MYSYMVKCMDSYLYSTCTSDVWNMTSDAQKSQEIFLPGVRKNFCTSSKISQDVLKSTEFFLGGVRYIFCTSTKITLKTNHIQTVQQQDHIDERSNPTSQPTNYTTNNMNCVVGALLFGSFDFLMVIRALDTNSTSTRNQPKIKTSKKQCAYDTIYIICGVVGGLTSWIGSFVDVILLLDSLDMIGFGTHLNPCIECLLDFRC